MKRWYVIQVFAGYEDMVKRDLEQKIKETNAEDLFGQILIPSAKMRHFFDAADALQNQQMFPGYLLVEMDAQTAAIRLITKTNRVMRFLGGKDPVALSQKEIDRIMKQMSGGFVVTSEEHGLEAGKDVEIKDGPFIGFSGVIDSIDEQAQRLVIMVSIFGRMTPVELRFDQIKR